MRQRRQRGRRRRCPLRHLSASIYLRHPQAIRLSRRRVRGRRGGFPRLHAVAHRGLLRARARLRPLRRRRALPAHEPVSGGNQVRRSRHSWASAQGERERERFKGGGGQVARGRYISRRGAIHSYENGECSGGLDAALPRRADKECSSDGGGGGSTAAAAAQQWREGAPPGPRCRLGPNASCRHVTRRVRSPANSSSVTSAAAAAARATARWGVRARSSRPPSFCSDSK